MPGRLIAALVALAASGAAILLWDRWPWRASYAIFTASGEPVVEHGRFSTRDVCERMLLQITPSHPHHSCDHIRR